jgi:hypothetical protein
VCSCCYSQLYINPDVFVDFHGFFLALTFLLLFFSMLCRISWKGNKKRERERDWIDVSNTFKHEKWSHMSNFKSLLKLSFSSLCFLRFFLLHIFFILFITLPLMDNISSSGRCACMYFYSAAYFATSPAARCHEQHIKMWERERRGVRWWGEEKEEELEQV